MVKCKMVNQRNDTRVGIGNQRGSRRPIRAQYARTRESQVSCCAIRAPARAPSLVLWEANMGTPQEFFIMTFNGDYANSGVAPVVFLLI